MPSSTRWHPFGSNLLRSYRVGGCMECPVVKGLYTIAMTVSGATRQWCPNCQDWHESSEKSTKPREVSSAEKIEERRSKRGCK
jgi:hypothetical protein